MVTEKMQSLLLSEPETTSQGFWDDRFLQLAKLVSLWSKDPSTKVGAVIARPDKTVASVGYNGFPRGIPDHPEWYNDRELKYKIVRHAETNAISFAKEDLSGCTLYVYPLPPCSSCAGAIIQHNIKRVVCSVPESNVHRLDSDHFCFDLTKNLFQLSGIDFEVRIGSVFLKDPSLDSETEKV